MGISNVLSLLALIFLIMGLFFNITPSLPKFPWDIYINKPGFKVYIPIVSSLILSIILTILINSLGK